MDDDKLVLGTRLEQQPDQTESTDDADRSLITDISATMGLGSAAERARRRKQKLREALVCEHIQERERGKARLASLVGRGVKRS